LVEVLMVDGKGRCEDS